MPNANGAIWRLPFFAKMAGVFRVPWHTPRRYVAAFFICK
jgi:hypothetical protein